MRASFSAAPVNFRRSFRRPLSRGGDPGTAVLLSEHSARNSPGGCFAFTRALWNSSSVGGCGIGGMGTHVGTSGAGYLLPAFLNYLGLVPSGESPLRAIPQGQEGSARLPGLEEGAHTPAAQRARRSVDGVKRLPSLAPAHLLQAGDPPNERQAGRVCSVLQSRCGRTAGWQADAHALLSPGVGRAARRKARAPAPREPQHAHQQTTRQNALFFA